MAKINSKRKGKTGELEFAHECEKYGFTNVHRTAQTNGKLEQSLADCEGLEGIHIEVKRVEQLNIHKAMDQAVRDSEGHNEIPIVAHRKNNTKWLITMTAEDWFRLWYGIEKEVDKDGKFT